MAKQLLSKKRAKALSTSLFLVGLAILSYLGDWWPGLMLVMGVPLALRQCLLARYYDMVITLCIFGGAFASVQFDLSWQLLLPALFTVGAIYIFFRDFIEAKEEPETEREEDLNEEIEEEQHPK